MLRIRSFALVATLLAMAACHAKPAAPANTTIEAATFDSTLHVDLKASTRTGSGLYDRDLVAGDGPVASRGDSVSVTYTGWLSNGQKFDAGPYAFRLGTGAVIQGWDEGLVGMRAGGTRQLIIPSSLGYGAAGSPPAIPANAILVFNVVLVGVQ